VVTDLVRDHIGLRELAGLAADIAAAKPRLDILEERRVEIDLLVSRTIERAHRALRGAAALGVGAAAVEHEHRRTIVPAFLGKNVFPLRLGAAEHAADEPAHLVAWRAGL
jgi:ATP/maltotriose-dependent transcriptional regulator MalT